MPVIIGTKIGPYEILGPLGAGGMGEVYRAKDTQLEREVAIDAAHGVRVHWVVSRNRQQFLAFGHDDVFALLENAEPAFL